MLLVAIGGRVAKAFVGETQGMYRSSWSFEDVAEIDLIGKTATYH
jgi:hypothetical protein